MDIGCLPPVPETKPFLDRATALIVPVLEHLIPEALDRRLASLEHGECAGMLTLQRMLRLELLQACHPSHSFQAMLRHVWQVWSAAGLRPDDCPCSAALSRARERLPVWAVEMVFKATAERAAALLVCSPWAGHRLLSIDGTMLSMPKSTENEQHFGTTRSQHGAAYYPQALAVWICGVQQGTVLHHLGGTARQSDQRLGPHALRDFVRPGDLVFGDSHYGHYGASNVICNADAFFLTRAPANFQVAPRVVKTLGPNDREILLMPSAKIRRNYSDLDLRPELRARALTFTVPAKDAERGTEQADFLTNLPVQEFPPDVLERLVGVRWNHEIINNDIKTRLGLTNLRSEHVGGVWREVFAHLCVNNAIRLALCEARPLDAPAGSFLAAAQALAEANAQLRAVALSAAGVWAAFRLALRQHSVDVRPGRSEPRKHRPYKTTFPMFKTPRARYRERRKEVAA